MKRRILHFCVAALLCISTVLLWRLWPRPLPPEECSDIYRAYMDTPGVDASFVRGFQVNDTVTVDVTLLQATDSAGWERLITDANLSNDTKEVSNLYKHKKTVLIHAFPKGHMELPTATNFSENDLMAIDRTEQTLAIFHITDIKQLTAIISYHLNKVTP